MALTWFKFYGGQYLSDPKMLALTGSERSCWLTLLCLTSMSSGGEVKFLTEERLMLMAGLDIGTDEWDKTTGVLDKLTKLGMVTLSNDIVTVTNWNKRQLSESLERVRRFRTNKKSNVKVTDRSEKRREEEKREDKNISSSSLVATNVATPQSKAVNFFNNEETQANTLTWLVHKGIGEEVARRELAKFLSYWTEPNKSGTKQRWELQKTFEVGRRLATWFSRHQDFNKPQQGRERKIWKLD